MTDVFWGMLTLARFLKVCGVSRQDRRLCVASFRLGALSYLK